VGGIHGNEVAGIKAIDLVLKMLEVEPITNPNFEYRGNFVGLRGNLRAIKSGRRFIHHDLNRLWKEELVYAIIHKNKELEIEEEHEIKELWLTIKDLIHEYQPPSLVFLDLHTTSAQNGVFCIPAENEASLDLAKNLNVPVVLGLLTGLEATTLHYIEEKNTGVPTMAVCIEAGQHEDPLSVNRSVAAIINCLAEIGSVERSHVNNHHNTILSKYSKDFPTVTSLIYRHGIKEEDKFKMRPGYHNFQKISIGEHIADDKNGPITIQQECHILMPLYQNQGNDGFFLVKKESTK